jgi:hypothetical protein
MNEALQELLLILRDLGLRHMAVGSIASSIHGLPRFTNDTDLLVDIREEHVGPLVTRTKGTFYLDSDEARRSVAAGRAFNLIHLSSASKIDIFPAVHEFHATELKRSAVAEWIAPGSAAISLPVASAEDTVLSKLLWYKAGGAVSDRQWSDVLGIAARKKLDWGYIESWTAKLGIAGLSDRLRSETAG